MLCYDFDAEDEFGPRFNTSPQLPHNVHLKAYFKTHTELLLKPSPKINKLGLNVGTDIFWFTMEYKQGFSSRTNHDSPPLSTHILGDFNHFNYYASCH